MERFKLCSRQTRDGWARATVVIEFFALWQALLILFSNGRSCPAQTKSIQHFAKRLHYSLLRLFIFSLAAIYFVYMSWDNNYYEIMYVFTAGLLQSATEIGHYKFVSSEPSIIKRDMGETTLGSMLNAWQIGNNAQTSIKYENSSKLWGALVGTKRFVGDVVCLCMRLSGSRFSQFSRSNAEYEMRKPCQS